MKVIYEFADGLISEIEVTGELAAEYCVMAGIDPKSPPAVLRMSKIEKLAGRKHIRRHKYTGIHVSYEETVERGEDIAESGDTYGDIESAMVTEQALATLTELQRYCFVEVCLKGRTYRELAAERSKSLGTISEAVCSAKEKLKKFFT